MKAKRKVHAERCWAVVCPEGNHMPGDMSPTRAEALAAHAEGVMRWGMTCCRVAHVEIREVLPRKRAAKRGGK